MGLLKTRFSMHGVYQLAYCPINQIISYAFHDGAFFNTALTPELIWRLQVLKHSQSLPLHWKLEMLDIPLQRVERTPYSYELHKSLPMTYNSSREALQELGWDARFEDDIGHYNYRHWTANEVNHMFLLIERYLAGNISALDDERLLLLYLTCRLQEPLPVSRARNSRYWWTDIPI